MVDLLSAPQDAICHLKHECKSQHQTNIQETLQLFQTPTTETLTPNQPKFSTGEGGQLHTDTYLIQNILSKTKIYLILQVVRSITLGGECMFFLYFFVFFSTAFFCTI